jgi:hydrogenase maturation protease
VTDAGCDPNAAPPPAEQPPATLCRAAAGKTLVIGLGNPLIADDSVGLRVVAQLKRRLADYPGVDVTEDYWGGLRLMERMIGYSRAIVVDAICTGAVPPGTIHHLATDSLATQRSASAHDVNLPTALAFGRHAGVELPADQDVHLVGIEAQDVINFSEQCTPAVAEAIPRAVEEVVRLLDALLGGSRR